jgi:hypothetical protein
VVLVTLATAARTSASHCNIAAVLRTRWDALRFALLLPLVRSAELATPTKPTSEVEGGILVDVSCWGDMGLPRAVVKVSGPLSNETVLGRLDRCSGLAICACGSGW